MAVFPEGMNRLDVNDVPGSLSRIENYIRYMTDRMEFAMRNTTRSVSEAGVSSVEVMRLLNEMASAVSVISSTVNGMTGELTALNNRVTAMDNRITGLQGELTALTARVAALEGGTEGEPNGS